MKDVSRRVSQLLHLGKNMDASAAVTTIIVALFASVGPVLVVVLTGRQRRQETLETWARQDQVAETARVEAEAQRMSQQLIADEAHRTSVRLDIVHTLVNNTLTVEKERALLLSRQSLATLRVSIALMHELDRHDEAERVAVEIHKLEEAIISLEDELADRARQIQIAAPDIQETENFPMKET